MKNGPKLGLQHLDKAHVANCRISSISTLLMAYDDREVPESEDLRILADLIHSQSEIMRDCLKRFRQAVEMDSNSQ